MLTFFSSKIRNKICAPVEVEKQQKPKKGPEPNRQNGKQMVQNLTSRHAYMYIYIYNSLFLKPSLLLMRAIGAIRKNAEEYNKDELLKDKVQRNKTKEGS